MRDSKQFEWARGHTHAVDPQIVGEAVQQLMTTRGGISPNGLIELARPIDSPIHSLFVWDTQEAATLHNQRLAKHAISSLRQHIFIS